MNEKDAERMRIMEDALVEYHKRWAAKAARFEARLRWAERNAHVSGEMLRAYEPARKDG